MKIGPYREVPARTGTIHEDRAIQKITSLPNNAETEHF
jgi:hypothetical protein